MEIFLESSNEIFTSKQLPKKLRLSSYRHDSFCKKAIDNLCLRADMCDSLESMALTICEGMKELISIGIPRQEIADHRLAFSKILSLGEDIIEKSSQGEQRPDLFYIGIFINMKITTMWHKPSFYKMVLEMFAMLNSNTTKSLPRDIKEKMEKLLKADNYPLYTLYFK